MPRKASSAVSQPFLGLWYDRPLWQLDPRAFADCRNVRIYNGRVTSALMGWLPFISTQLNGPVTLVYTFRNQGVPFLVLGTSTDLYYCDTTGAVRYITPTVGGGESADVTHGSVTVTANPATSFWQTPIATGFRNAVRSGDQIAFGSSSVSSLSPSGGWYTVALVTSANSLTLTEPYAGTTASGIAYTIRQRFAGNNNEHRWHAETFPGAEADNGWSAGDKFFATNGADMVVIWDGGPTAAGYVVTVPYYVSTLQRFKNMMIYGGLFDVATNQNLFSTIANSDNSRPTVLNAGIAGTYAVTDGPYEINHLGILGNVLLIYMGSVLGGDVVSAQFVGFPTNFVFSEVIRGRGPLAGGLVFEFPDRHQFISSDGEYRYNGLFIQLMNTQAWRTILLSFDEMRAEQAFNLVVDNFGDLLIAMPLTSDGVAVVPQTAYVEHYLEQASNPLFKPITLRDFPFTALGDYPYVLPGTAATINHPIVAGDADGRLWRLYSSDQAAGIDVPAYVSFGQRLALDERHRGLVRRIYPFVEARPGLLIVTLGMFEQLSGPQVISDSQLLDMSFDPNSPTNTKRFTSHFRQGRVAQVQFGGVAPWTLEGYDLDVTAGGQR